MTVRAQNPNHSLGYQGTPGQAWPEGMCRKPYLLASVWEFAVLNPSCDCEQQRTVYSTRWGHPCACGCGTGRGMVILSNKHLSNFQDKFPRTHVAYGKGKNWNLEWLFLRNSWPLRTWPLNSLRRGNAWTLLRGPCTRMWWQRPPGTWSLWRSSDGSHEEDPTILMELQEIRDK